MPRSNDALCDSDLSEIMSPDDDTEYSRISSSNGTDPTAYASITHNGAPNFHRRSSSCDCLDRRETAAEHLEDMSNERPGSHNALYDKLAPVTQTDSAIIYDSLRPSKSESSSPDPTIDQKMDYMRRSHKYEYVDVELENRSEKSGSNSPIGMEHPSDWTNSLPITLFRRESPKKPTRTTSSKETKTMSRRKQLPLQESTEREKSTSERSTIPRVCPPRLSKENSIDSTDSPRHLIPNCKSQARSSAESIEFLSSIESVPELKRASVFSNGSTSSGEMELKPNHHDHMKQEHSNTPITRVTHEEVELKLKQSDTSQDPPPLPRRGPTEASLKDEVLAVSPQLPPRPQEPRFTMPLPQAQFDFNNPPPLPRPKVLCPSDLSYVAVTFASEEKPHLEPVTRAHRPPMRMYQEGSDVSYVAVDFNMTEGLQRTSEQVADHHREFLEFKQHS